MAESYGSSENGNPANAYADALARARQVGLYVFVKFTVDAFVLCTMCGKCQ